MVIEFDKNRPTLSEFNRQCIEKIPPADMREIIAGAKFDADQVFDHADDLSMPRGFCSSCQRNGEEPVFGFLIFDILTGRSWCKKCYEDKLVRDRCQAWLDRDACRIPLDYEDFIRI